MYPKTRDLFSANRRMPFPVEDYKHVVQKVCSQINIQIFFDEVCKRYRKKRLHIIEQLETSRLTGYIRSHEEVTALQCDRSTCRTKRTAQKQFKTQTQP